MRKLFWGSVAALWFLVLAILTDLTEDVVNSESIINFDRHWSGVFLSWRTNLGTDIFSVITLLGNWQFAIPLFVVALIIVFKKYNRFLWPFIFTVLSAETVTFIGKILVHRVRPDGAAMEMLDFSFPSGHATIAVALYGYLTYLIISQVKRKTTKAVVLISGVSLILIIGFSRLYLGVHYVTDIIAGYLVGTLALLAGISLKSWLEFRTNQKPKLR